MIKDLAYGYSRSETNNSGFCGACNGWNFFLLKCEGNLWNL
jgi:hypothetical protein